MSDSIKLSEKHGLNPSITICPICGKETGIAILGELKNDEEAPKKIIGDLCEDCKEDSKTHCFILEVNNDIITGRYFKIEKENISEEFRDHSILLMDSKEFNKISNGETQE